MQYKLEDIQVGDMVSLKEIVMPDYHIYNPNEYFEVINSRDKDGIIINFKCCCGPDASTVCGWPLADFDNVDEIFLCDGSGGWYIRPMDILDLKRNGISQLASNANEDSGGLKYL